MTDGQKLALILDHMYRRNGTCAFNIQGGYAFDRVAKKAVRKGFITVSTKSLSNVGFLTSPNFTYRVGRITKKGIEKIEVLYKKNKVPPPTVEYMTEKEFLIHLSGVVGRSKMEFLK